MIEKGRGTNHPQKLEDQMNKSSVTHDEGAVKRLPSYADIITAPEDEWRDLVRLVDGDEDFYARVRAHHQRKQEEKDQSTPKKKRSRGGSRSRKRQSAADALQAQINRSTAEALDRVNDDDDDTDDPPEPKAASRLIPVNHYSQGTFMLEVPA